MLRVYSRVPLLSIGRKVDSQRSAVITQLHITEGAKAQRGCQLAALINHPERSDRI